ncbi:MAG: helix-turn-helix transcriptional regulator [Alphaproteobacteria bacterium]|nr:helix-turn-helix transcriptional regulator [Alphaproteobacteria bacterium]
MTTMDYATRSKAANACLSALDADFFKALCETSRLEVVRGMIKLGRADISDIAEEVPLDRSVVSRHLQTLEQAGLAVSSKEGRRVFYELDGPAIMDKFGNIMAALAPLVPYCCPSPK